MNLKLLNAEATKARAIIADADRLTRQHQDILQDVGGYFVVNDLDLKAQFPSRLESRTGAGDAGALDYHRAIIDIERLVTVSIQLLRDREAVVVNEIRGHKYIGRDEITIALSPLACDLEIYRRLL